MVGFIEGFIGGFAERSSEVRDQERLLRQRNFETSIKTAEKVAAENAKRQKAFNERLTQFRELNKVVKSVTGREADADTLSTIINSSEDLDDAVDRVRKGEFSIQGQSSGVPLEQQLEPSRPEELTVESTSGTRREGIGRVLFGPGTSVSEDQLQEVRQQTGLPSLSSAQTSQQTPQTTQVDDTVQQDAQRRQRVSFINRNEVIDNVTRDNRSFLDQTRQSLSEASGGVLSVDPAINNGFLVMDQVSQTVTSVLETAIGPQSELEILGRNSFQTFASQGMFFLGQTARRFKNDLGSGVITEEGNLAPDIIEDAQLFATTASRVSSNLMRQAGNDPAIMQDMLGNGLRIVESSFVESSLQGRSLQIARTQATAAFVDTFINDLGQFETLRLSNGTIEVEEGFLPSVGPQEEGFEESRDIAISRDLEKIRSIRAQLQGVTENNLSVLSLNPRMRDITEKAVRSLDNAETELARALSPSQEGEPSQQETQETVVRQEQERRETRDKQVRESLASAEVREENTDILLEITEDLPRVPRSEVTGVSVLRPGQEEELVIPITSLDKDRIEEIGLIAREEFLSKAEEKFGKTPSLKTGDRGVDVVRLRSLQRKTVKNIIESLRIEGSITDMDNFRSNMLSTINQDIGEEQSQRVSEQRPESIEVEQQNGSQEAGSNEQTNKLEIDEVANNIAEAEGFTSTVVPDNEGRVIGFGFNIDTDKQSFDNAVKKAREQGEITPTRAEIFINNTETISMREEEARSILKARVEQSVDEANSFISNFEELPREAKETIIDIIFNVGSSNIRSFDGFKKAVEEGNFNLAADELKFIDPSDPDRGFTDYFKQTGPRARKNVNRLKLLDE